MIVRVLKFLKVRYVH